MPAVEQCISQLRPNQHNVHLQVKVIDWMVSVDATVEGTKQVVSEYLVADHSGCVMLRVTSPTRYHKDNWLEITGMHTQVMESSIRLVVEKPDQIILLASAPTDAAVNTNNNISFIEYSVHR
ncbi:hypothetical protein DM01DRAFT_1338138 [Hesseltinella vesiculosa]|uniref:Uncharacterized protein n=1 Tax=Hesseltinella vesiculosa TaxID=101127 RepID=A0A1X2GC18_9FUNG|nr:hypothetical protein DM01DRAFT_1338138 [Hesseltinella vesiculosa]